MTLLMTAFAAIISTIIWYNGGFKSVMKLGFLCLMYWGAFLMWIIDALFEYLEVGAKYFTPEPLDMVNDLFLGLSVVALGLIIWLAAVLIKDPKGVIKEAILRQKKSN